MTKIDENIFLNLYEAGNRTVDNLIDTAFKPLDSKSPMTYSLREAAELIGVSHTHLDARIKSGEVEASKEGKRYRITQPQVEAAREKLNKQVGRSLYPGSKAVTINIANQKGGAGKSTTALHLAQGSARRGYKVLLVDGDSQATLTWSFGIRAESDIQDTETLLGAFYCPANPATKAIENWNLRSSIIKTNWSNLDLVPANSALHEIDTVVAKNIMEMGKQGKPYPFHLAVQQAIEAVKDDYDIIIIDSPPNLGLYATSLLLAADAVIIPMNPTIFDYTSTNQFNSLIAHTIKYKPDGGFEFLRYLVSQDDPGQSAEMVRGWLRAIYQEYLMNNTFKKSEPIKKIGLILRTVYEAEDYKGDRRTLTHAVEMVEKVVLEVLGLVEEVWQRQAKEKAA